MEENGDQTISKGNTKILLFEEQLKPGLVPTLEASPRNAETNLSQ